MLHDDHRVFAAAREDGPPTVAISCLAGDTAPCRSATDPTTGETGLCWIEDWFRTGRYVHVDPPNTCPAEEWRDAVRHQLATAVGPITVPNLTYDGFIGYWGHADPIHGDALVWWWLLGPRRPYIHGDALVWWWLR